MTKPDDLPRDPALSALYREQLPSEPSAALDATILDAARQALEPPRRPWWQRLQAPVALAATVTLAVMLTLTMERHPPEAEAPAPQAAPQPVATEPGAETKPTADVAAQPRRQTAQATKDDRAAPKKTPAAHPTPPAAATANEYRPAPAAPASNNASPPAERAKAGDSMEVDQSKLLAAPPMPATRAPSAPAASGAMPRSRGEAQLPSPEEWISRIRQLRLQNKTAEAAAQWQSFRKAYPDYPLPDDLRDSP